MQPYKKEQIERTIFLENATRERLNLLTDQVAEILKPFIGQKVLNKDGTALKKLKDQLSIPDVQLESYNGHPVQFRAWVKIDEYTIMIQSQTILHAETGYMYHEGYRYIGRIQENVLTEVHDKDPAPALVAADQLRDYDLYEQKKEELEQIRERIYHKLLK